MPHPSPPGCDLPTQLGVSSRLAGDALIPLELCEKICLCDAFGVLWVHGSHSPAGLFFFETN